MLVKKKGGTLRFSVEKRMLKNVTKVVYQFPLIDDALDRICSARYVSSIDLKSDCWQIELDERNRGKTAFISPDGLMLCSRGIPAFIDTVLGDLKW